MINDFQIISKEKELDKQLLILLILSLLLLTIPFFRPIAFVIFGSMVVYFIYRFDFMKTKTDFFRFMIYKIKLERELIDSRFYVKLRSRKDGRIFVKLPKVEIFQKSDYIIIVKISCSIENFERLEKLDLSPIFSGYRQMIVSNDIERDKIVFELEKINFDRQLKI